MRINLKEVSLQKQMQQRNRNYMFFQIIPCNGAHEYVKVTQTTSVNRMIQVWWQCCKCGKMLDK
jgi:hypothetical protein